MSVRQSIEKRIGDALGPLHLEVIDESRMHSVPEGAESHFKVVVVSEHFAGVKLVERHRMINGLLKPQFETGLHALALHAMTPEEWFAKGGAVPSSPECMGGSK